MVSGVRTGESFALRLLQPWVALPGVGFASGGTSYFTEAEGRASQVCQSCHAELGTSQYLQAVWPWQQQGPVFHSGIVPWEEPCPHGGWGSACSGCCRIGALRTIPALLQ